MKEWEALKALQEGKKIRRKCWPKGTYRILHNDEIMTNDWEWCGYMVYHDWELYEEPKPEVKIGQIWENKISGKIFCVTNASKRVVDCIRKDGWTGHQCVSYFFENSSDLRLVAEYPTWEEAVNSKEWKEGK